MSVLFTDDPAKNLHPLRYLVLGRWTNSQGVAGGLEIMDLCDDRECVLEHIKNIERKHGGSAGVTDVRILEVIEWVR